MFPPPEAGTPLVQPASVSRARGFVRCRAFGCVFLWAALPPQIFQAPDLREKRTIFSPPPKAHKKLSPREKRTIFKKYCRPHPKIAKNSGRTPLPHPRHKHQPPNKNFPRAKNGLSSKNVADHVLRIAKKRHERTFFYSVLGYAKSFLVS